MKNVQNSLHTFLKQKTDLEKIRDCFKLIAIKKYHLFSPEIVSGHISKVNQTASKN